MESTLSESSLFGTLSERKPIEQHEQYDSNLMKEGYLQKKGQMLKGWKQRWFVCDGRMLMYYTSRRDIKPTAAIDLKHCIVEDGGKSETWNSVRIHLTDHSTGTMYCLSSEEGQIAMEWLIVLTNAIQALGKQEKRSQRSSQPPLTISTIRDEEKIEKRMVRMVSAPSTTGTSCISRSPSRTSSSPKKHPSSPKKHSSFQKTPPLVTTVAIENELSRDTDAFCSLLRKNSSSIVFTPIGGSQRILKNIGYDPHQKQWIGRGSVILPIPIEASLYYISDHSERMSWDIQFPIATHVGNYDALTELLHLKSSPYGWNGGRWNTSHVALVVAIAVLGTSSWLMVVSVVVIAVLYLKNPSLYDPTPRDMLLLRQINKKYLSSETVEEVEEGATFRGITILEKSVVNERKPTSAGVIRAFERLSGWYLEPLEDEQTLVTFVSSIDPKGWYTMDQKRDFVVQRLDCLAVLLEHVNQTRGLREQMEFDQVLVKEEDDAEAAGIVTRSTATSLAPVAAFHPSEYFKGMVRLPSGSLKLTDKEVAKKQAGVLKEVLKSASQTLMEGKGLVSLSLPVRIFEPRTNLERVVDSFLYAPTFLNTAADSTDPVERFKWVITFAIAGLHHGVGQLKPFNPILGETYQAKLNDGTEVGCEHTSHHPPITNFQLMGLKYSICGHVLWNSPAFSMKSSAFIQNNTGPIRVSFPNMNETTIVYHLPQIQCSGFLWGDRTVEILGSMRFEDEMNNLVCELKFNPDEKKGMGGMFSSALTPCDSFRGIIINLKTNQELSSVSGSWLEGIEFDRQSYWTLGKQTSGYLVEMGPVLESDSRFREDLRYLAANDLDMAQEWKVKLEILQRADRKLRNDGRRANHWTMLKEKQGGNAH